jgi:DNA-binding CsgD family transcriptional regulator
LLADLSTPIAEAFRRAALLRSCEASAATEAPGLLVFDQRGDLVSFNDQAEMWLRELPPLGPEARYGFSVPIPTELRSVIALTRAIAAGIEQGTARTRVQGRNGRWLVIHGFPMRGSMDSECTTAIVIEPAKAAEIAPIIVEAYDLGSREQEITQLIARGLSTAEIAQHLYLSPYTVRDYVKRVFEKVGVSSRGELVARIFGEHYLGPLQASLVHVDTSQD